MNDFYKKADWLELRAWILEERGNRCERCGHVSKSPHVHHSWGLGHEDYEVLCPGCHAHHHSHRPDTATCNRCGASIEWVQVVEDWDRDCFSQV